MTTNRERSEKIAALNDELRKDPTNRERDFMTMTSGVAALGPEFWLRVVGKIASLEPKDFDQCNDPYGERNFNAFDVDGHRLYFKIDYYQKGTNNTAGAETPENPETTDYLLTVMLREEY